MLTVGRARPWYMCGISQNHNAQRSGQAPPGGSRIGVSITKTEPADCWGPESGPGANRQEDRTESAMRPLAAAGFVSQTIVFLSHAPYRKPSRIFLSHAPLLSLKNFRGELCRSLFSAPAPRKAAGWSARSVTFHPVCRSAGWQVWARLARRQLRAPAAAVAAVVRAFLASTTRRHCVSVCTSWVRSNAAAPRRCDHLCVGVRCETSGRGAFSGAAARAGCDR